MILTKAGMLFAVVMAAGAATAQTPDQIAAAKAAHQPVVVVTEKKQLYPPVEQAQADVRAALLLARKEHKRVILDFGGDWCGDCQVLDIYFHHEPNLSLLEKNFVLVHVFINETMDNADHVTLAAKYGVPIAKGVPALAVLDANGVVLYAQKTGQFNDMRHMDPGSVSEFLNKWKG